MVSRNTAYGQFPVADNSKVYLDVNVARNSQTYGNVHVFKKEYMPKAQKLQKVRVATEIDVEKVRDMIADSVTDPKTCDDLAKVRAN